MKDLTNELQGEPRTAGAESGRRLLRVLLSFTESRPLWTVSKLSDELKLTPSAIYRYIGLLREVGLVDSAPGNLYRVSDLAASIAAAASAGRAPLADVALPVLTRLRDASGETVFVARRSGWRVFTVGRVESRKPVRLQFEPGQAMNLHTGSLSRILLASMPRGERNQYLASLSPELRSRDTLSSESLDLLHSLGVTESFEEIDEGIWGVSSSIALDGVVVGAIGCAAPIFRTDPDRRKIIRDLIVEGAAEIAHNMLE